MEISALTGGGIVAAVIVAAERLLSRYFYRSGRFVTKKDMEKEIAVVNDRIKESAVAHVQATDAIAFAHDAFTKALAEEVKDKVDTQDIKLKILEHQKDCLSEIKIETRGFQAQMLVSFIDMQKSNQDSFRRVHERMDALTELVSGINRK